jgi:hypothetical protein
VLLLAGAVRLVGYVGIKDADPPSPPLVGSGHVGVRRLGPQDTRGDWLSRSDVKPYHSWQQYIARTVRDASDLSLSTSGWAAACGATGSAENYEDPFHPYFWPAWAPAAKVGAVY